MEVGTRVEPVRRADERVDELVVLLAPDALVAESQIQRVVEELLVVRAAVEDDGQCPVRVDAGAERGQHQLGDGDENAARALVADAQDLLAVCGYMRE